MSILLLRILFSPFQTVVYGRSIGCDRRIPHFSVIGEFIEGKIFMKKLLVYVITLNNEIIAISEYSEAIKAFYIQNNYDKSDDYDMRMISDQQLCEEVLIMYSELYITDLIIAGKTRAYIRTCDMQEVNHTIQCIHDSMINAFETLATVDDVIKLNKLKDIGVCHEAANILRKNIRNINYSKIVQEYYSDKNMMVDTFTNMCIY